MKILWKVDAADVRRVKEFFDRHKGNTFVEKRIEKKIASAAKKRPITKDLLWEKMIGCLLTTQQRSGPGSSVTRFIKTSPFLLRRDLCQKRTNLDVFVTKVLTKFGGLRRTTTIGREAKSNCDYLESGGWQHTFEVLEQVRLHSDAETERRAARFVDEHFSGLTLSRRETCSRSCP